MMSKAKTSDLIDQYIDMKGINNMEWYHGVRNMIHLAWAVGYGNQIDQNALVSFLHDNPGAIEAIQDWMRKQNCDYWNANLISRMMTDKLTTKGE
jgi:hypothetical protein